MEKRPKYDKAYKEQTVLKILSNEATIAEMSQALKGHYTTVRDWVRSYNAMGAAVFLAAAT